MVRAAGALAIAAGMVPIGAHAAAAASTTVPNGCQTSAQANTWSEIDLIFVATPPTNAAAGTGGQVGGLSVTASLAAAYITAGIGLGLLHDGQSLSGTANVTVVATNATPASTSVTGTGSGTVHAPGGVAQPLSILVPLTSATWTPTAAGAVTLAEPLTGSQTNSLVPGLTNGAVELDASLGTGTVRVLCKPGTVTSATPAVYTAATATAPFVTFQAAAAGSGGTTTTTSAGGTTTTAAGGTTTTSTTSTTAAPSSVAMTVSNTTNLTPGQVVSVTGTGFDASATVAILECSPLAATAANAQNECDISHATTVTTGSNGAFSTTFKVVETGAPAPGNFAPADPSAQCPAPAAQGSCVLAAANVLNTTQHASVNVSFAGPATGTIVSRSVAGPATLAFTGSTRQNLLLTGLALVLLDVGYLAISATRARRRRWRRG